MSHPGISTRSGGVSPRRLGRGLLAASLAVGALVAADGASAAPPHVYWTNGGGTVGRADLDGTSADQAFMTTQASNIMCVVADDEHIYWCDATHSTIGRADLDGTNVDDDFIATTGPPYAIALTDDHIHWTTSTARTIGRADLDGTNVNPSLVTASSDTYGLFATDDHIYWGRNGARIGRADLDGANVNDDFITTASSNPFGIYVDAGHVYWSEYSYGRIGRADLDGANVDTSFIAGAGSFLTGLHGDDQHLYWTNNDYPPGITRADIDGTNVDTGFITGASQPRGPFVADSPPAIASTDPAAGATGVALDESPSVTFDEDIALGAGSIELRRSSDDSVVESFDVVSSDRVGVSGDTLTIYPTDDLAEGTGYYVWISDGAIVDLEDNPFGGIDDATAWSFTTRGGAVDEPAPETPAPETPAPGTEPALPPGSSEGSEPAAGTTPAPETEAPAPVGRVMLPPGGLGLRLKDGTPVELAAPFIAPDPSRGMPILLGRGDLALPAGADRAEASALVRRAANGIARALNEDPETRPPGAARYQAIRTGIAEVLYIIAPMRLDEALMHVIVRRGAVNGRITRARSSIARGPGILPTAGERRALATSKAAAHMRNLARCHVSGRVRAVEREGQELVVVSPKASRTRYIRCWRAGGHLAR